MLPASADAAQRLRCGSLGCARTAAATETAAATTETVTSTGTGASTSAISTAELHLLCLLIQHRHHPFGEIIPARRVQSHDHLAPASRLLRLDVEAVPTTRSLVIDLHHRRANERYLSGRWAWVRESRSSGRPHRRRRIRRRLVREEAQRPWAELEIVGLLAHCQHPSLEHGALPTVGATLGLLPHGHRVPEVGHAAADLLQQRGAPRLDHAVVFLRQHEARRDVLGRLLFRVAQQLGGAEPTHVRLEHGVVHHLRDVEELRVVVPELLPALLHVLLLVHHVRAPVLRGERGHDEAIVGALPPPGHSLELAVRLQRGGVARREAPHRAERQLGIDANVECVLDVRPAVLARLARGLADHDLHIAEAEARRRGRLPRQHLSPCGGL